MRVLDRGAVVGHSRAVRRADLDQARAARAHDVGDPELAADLDQLAARDEHLLALRERGEREQQRRGAVVHDERGLGPGIERGSKLGAHGAIPAPVAAVDLEVGVGRGRLADRLDARSASGARPRFVCRTTPVALITGVSPWPRAPPGRRPGQGSRRRSAVPAVCGGLPDGLELVGHRALEHGSPEDARGALARVERRSASTLGTLRRASPAMGGSLSPRSRTGRRAAGDS